MKTTNLLVPNPISTLFQFFLPFCSIQPKICSTKKRKPKPLRYFLHAHYLHCNQTTNLSHLYIMKKFANMHPTLFCVVSSGLVETSSLSIRSSTAQSARRSWKQCASFTFHTPSSSGLHKSIGISLLLCAFYFLMQTPSAHAATNVYTLNQASIVISPGVSQTPLLTLTLTFNGPNDPFQSWAKPYVGLSSFFNIFLQEGFLSSQQLGATVTSVSGATVTFSLIASIHKKLPFETFYSLTMPSQTYYGADTMVFNQVSNFDLSVTDSCPTCASFISDSQCNPPLNDKINSLADLQSVGASECTQWPKPLIISSLTNLSSKILTAGLGLIRSIQGYLLIENNTYFTMNAFVSLTNIVTNNFFNPLFNGTDSIVIENNLQLDGLSSLNILLNYTSSGDIIVINNGMCLQSDGRMLWSRPNVVVIYNISDSCDCVMYSTTMPNSPQPICTSIPTLSTTSTGMITTAKGTTSPALTTTAPAASPTQPSLCASDVSIFTVADVQAWPNCTELLGSLEVASPILADNDLVRAP